MKYIKGLLVCLFTFVLFSSNSCNKVNEITEIDVQFNCPETMKISASDNTYTFKVLFGKAPLESDIIVLTDSYKKDNECQIIKLSSSSFTIRLFEGICNGSYTISLKRGNTTKTYGQTKVAIEDNIQAEGSNTIYGKVFYNDGSVQMPLKDVVVSDGVEVVTTNSEGVYQIKSAKKYGYVFVSVPSGYEVAKDGVLPMLYQKLIYPEDVAERVDFQLNPTSGQENHTILVFGDMHLANRNNDRGQFTRFVNDVNEYVSSNSGKKIYALTLGDMTWDLYWKDNNYAFDAYLNDVNKIQNLTIYHTIGNHDHDMYYAGDFDTILEYKKYLAPDYYSFNIGKVHYIILDNILCTNTGAGTSSSRNYSIKITDEQLAWIKKDLEHVAKSTPIIVAMHAALSNFSSTNRNALLNVFTAYDQVHFMTGHTHKVSNSFYSERHDHNSGAVCATWWWTGKNTNNKVHIGQDGAPGGYQIFTINGNEMKWQYKATGSSTDYQFRTYDRNQIELSAEKYLSSAETKYKTAFDAVSDEWVAPSSANEVYINVWNYNTNWTIEVQEESNGTYTKLTNLEKVSGICDPLHILSYCTYGMKTNTSPTFKTDNCGHLWRVKASSASSTLIIKVTDSFGNTYTETMKRPRPFTLEEYTK